jgi:phage-related protein
VPAGRVGKQSVGHRWRDFETSGGARPVKEFITRLSVVDQAEVVAAMKDVAIHGLAAARHLRGDLYEVRALAPGGSYRVLFALEGEKGRILLALAAFAKKSQKTPSEVLRTAETRLVSWRKRA